MSKVLLNNLDHHDLRLIARGGRAFGDTVNQVLVYPTEFEIAAREFPIVIRPDAQGRLRPVAVLGLERDDNLFLGPDGSWQSAYVPAVLEARPFAIGTAGNGTDLQILVNPNHPLLSREQGEPLFLEHGGHAPALEAMLGVLRAIYVGNTLLDPMVEALTAAGLLRPFDIQLHAGPDRAYAISDAQTIDRDRLAALDGGQLAALHLEGFLHSAFMLAASLGNMQRLVDRMAARLTAEENVAA